MHLGILSGLPWCLACCVTTVTFRAAPWCLQFATRDGIVREHDTKQLTQSAEYALHILSTNDNNANIGQIF